MHTNRKHRYLLVEVAVVLVLSLAMAVGSYARTRVWSSSVTLWSDAALKGPSRYRAANNAGAALIAEQRFDEAITFLVWAVAANPRSVEPYYNLGVAYLQQRNIDSALPHFKEVLNINKSLKGGHYGYKTRLNMVVGSAANLGNIYSLRGDMGEAVYYYKEAIALDPGALSVRFNLAQAYQRTGRTGLAIEELEELLRLDPSDRGARRAIFQLKKQ